MTPANKIANLLYTATLLLLLGGWVFLELSLWWMLLPTAVWLGLKINGSIFIQWNYYLFSHCSKKTEQRKVALTFDDGPDEANTAKLLDLLDEYGVRATFFVIGKKAKQQPALVKMIHKRGHLLGNHSYEHGKFFDLYNVWRMRNELLVTHEHIYKITGIKTLLFRPPYGVTNPVLARSVKVLGYTSIGWSVRSFDTSRSSAQTMQRLTKKTHPGAIVLLHDTTPDILQITRNYLEWLKTNQYSVVPLDQLLSLEAYE